MKIIIVTPAVPHPFGDTAAKWYYVLIRELLKRGHQVVSITSSQDPPDRIRHAEQLLREGNGSGNLTFRHHAWRSRYGTIRRKFNNFRRPFSEILMDCDFMEELKKQLSGGYDVLHLEQLFTGWVGLSLPGSLINIHHFEVIDWEGRKIQSAREKRALWQMQRATTQILRRSQNMRMFTPRLLEKAKTINPNARYWVLPFALDLTLYPVQPPVEEPVVGLIGSMHWIPSRSAGERLLSRIWPLVKRKMPGARLYIAGWNANKYLKKYLPMPDVVLEENLGHPTDFFSKVSVMAYAPSRGSGMKIKVLESMAYGVPVVTTWEGAEGIDYENGVHCWVEEEDEAIAERVCALLRDSDARNRMRDAARSLVEAKYSPSPVVDGMMGIYSDMARRR